MGLSTRVSRLLHKCRENDTICVLKAAKLVLLWLRFSINDSVTSCAVWSSVATGVNHVNIRLLPFSTSDNIRFLHCSLI